MEPKIAEAFITELSDRSRKYGNLTLYGLMDLCDNQAAQLAAKDAEIEGLRKHIESLDDENESLDGEIEKANATIARLREAGRNILPYLEWTIGDESPGYHPTMPSAVAAFKAALKETTNG